VAQKNSKEGASERKEATETQCFDCPASTSIVVSNARDVENRVGCGVSICKMALRVKQSRGVYSCQSGLSASNLESEGSAFSARNHPPNDGASIREHTSGTNRHRGKTPSERASISTQCHQIIPPIQWRTPKTRPTAQQVPPDRKRR